MPYLFTSESVSEGHPDKVADQISDAVLDEMLRQDPNSRVACETLVTTGLALLAGEVKSKATIDLQKTVRKVIRDIGYTRAEYRFDAESCSVLSALHEQSSDINQGVDREDESQQGAGDQGMMFGYATNETENLMPLTADISHKLLEELARIRKEGRVMTYLRPDSKSQVTINYSDDDVPLNIQTIVISTQHDEFDGEEKMQQVIADDIRTHLIPAVRKGYPENIQRLFDHDFVLHVNPTGKFVIGGPHGDTGLTGRKIIVDTYGGHGAHGGGAFSGKDSSKVDRSAAYATRHIAKNMVAAGVADRMLVQVAYAIGIAEPVGLHIETYGTAKVKGQDGRTLTDGEIGEITRKLFDLRPYKIVERFNLKKPIFLPTASYGHFGKEAFEKEIQLASGKEKVTFFGWEKLDRMSEIKKEFNIS